MGIMLSPEARLARMVVRKYSLLPPVDIQALVNMYARLSFTHIPFPGVDGISLNLKSPGATHVIVNNNCSRLRQRFTMAHELGHILIPWHVGAVVIDHVDPVGPDQPRNWSTKDWVMENEANSFAAELLMPHSWIQDLISVTPDLSEAHRVVSSECKISALSSAIRLSQLLPDKIVYASVKNGKVEFSGRTNGTIASPLDWGIDFPSDAFNYSEQHYVSTVSGRSLHWWKLPQEIHIDTSDERSWKEILDGILHEICDNEDDIAQYKKSINGVIGYANSTCREKSNIDAVVSACVQRLRDLPSYHAVVEHDDFLTFIRKRAGDIATRSRP